MSRAAEARGLALPEVRQVAEHPGEGMSGLVDGVPTFLGRRAGDAKGVPFALHHDGRIVPLPLTETLRPGADRLVADLAARGLPVAMISGDRTEAVERVALSLGIADWTAGATPAHKLELLQSEAAAGERVLMIGDGLNDGPALAAAHASIAPADGSDLSSAAADIVVMGDDISRVDDAITVSRSAHRLILQNFAIAASYNAVAIPVAVAGYASPLAASLAMSTSSILVTLNALRLLRRSPLREGPDRAILPRVQRPGREAARTPLEVSS